MKVSPQNRPILKLGALRHTPASQRWMSVRPMVLQSGVLSTRKSMRLVTELSSYNSDIRIQNPRGKK